MQTLVQVILAFVIAALLLTASVVALAIQVIKTLAQIEGPPDALRAKSSRFGTERKTLG
jgi:hypothetical protein